MSNVAEILNIDRKMWTWTQEVNRNVLKYPREGSIMSTACVNINFSDARVKAHLGCNPWSLWFSEEFAPKGRGSLSAYSACGLRPQTVKVTTIILSSTLEQTILIKDLPLSRMKVLLPSVNKQILKSYHLYSQVNLLKSKRQPSCTDIVNIW